MFDRCLHSKCSKTALLGTMLVAALVVLPLTTGTCATDAAPKFEVPQTLSASAILPADMLSGPHYKVRDRVVTYGYMHSFVVDSDYGVFDVTGDLALRKLIREIGAIASLQEVKKGRAFVDGVKTAASKPVEFGANLITDPVDTVSGVPKGIAALFQNVKTGLTTQSDAGQDSKMAQAMTVSANKRELARNLGVDVYSRNKVLQKELNSVAWATALGSLSVSAALAPVGGAAVAAVSASRGAQQLNDLVNEYPPQRLREMNQQKMDAMSIPPDVALRFLDSQVYTPTERTAIVESLDALSGAKGREVFILQVLSAEDEESTDYFVHVAEMLKWYHTAVSPIREISVYGPMIFAHTGNGTAFIPLPLDCAMWTEKSSQRVPAAVNAYKAMNPGTKKMECWVTGTVSKMAKEEGSKIGLKAVEKVENRIPLSL